jgi:hypothetical protein
MTEIINIKCGIENCNQVYDYKFDENIVIAISGQWRNEQSKGGIWTGLLADKPIEGQNYELFIQSPLKIDLKEKFWSIYFEPYTAHEGIESENGIKSMLFCLCSKTKIFDIGTTNARIEIKVIKVLNTNNLENIEKTNGLRSKFLDQEINSQYCSVQNFETYNVISANYQSDCGWTYIIEKKDGKSVIIAEKKWDFHTDIWIKCNEDLTSEQEVKYGITHIKI